MNANEKSKTTNPIAPIVLNTFATPTASTHGTIAKTKMVESMFLTKVRLTSASPTIYTW